MTGKTPLVGPHFSTFTKMQVKWLLTDYSNLALEHPVAEREGRIQSGERHYAEDLPTEHLPEPAYQLLVDHLIRACAPDVAQAVENVTDQIAGARPTGVVLVSLVRAGVPAGIWISEALRRRHGMRVRHYAMSIVKGHGLDPHALDYLLDHEDPSHIMFVDGWTGKGSIRQELRDYLVQHASAYAAIPTDLAVLADPGGFSTFAGTRDDLLIPTATLNSTSCGLISRTVLPPCEASAGQFHGAKFYREFTAQDRSQLAISTVAEHISADRSVFAPQAVDPVDVTTLARQLDSSVELMKPGIGETTRVLQRRVPDRVVVHPDHVSSPRLLHIASLAHVRGVPVTVHDTGPYACIGIVQPLFRAP